MTARALTVRQPWASLIITGLKTVENRSWPVPSTVGGWGFACRCGKYPFRLWVHAGKTVDRDAVRQYGSERLWCPEAYPVGVLLGSVLVTGCHHADDHADDDADFPFLVDGEDGWQCSPWAERDRFHWTLTDPQPLPEPIPMRGRQGLWRLPADVAVPA